MNVILGILSSGFVTIIITILATERSKNKDRKSDFLSRQIQSLYGPVYFLFSANQKIHNLILEFRKARMKLSGDAFEKAIFLENDYVALIENNNDTISSIIHTHSDLMDSEDTSLFLNFFQDSIRSKIEREPDGKFKLPDLSNEVGDIHFLQPKLISQLKERCEFKKGQMKILRGEKQTCCCNCDI